jgi:Trk-type K+ transport system membrane component
LVARRNLTGGNFRLTDWFFFMVLDIGNPDIESIPLNVRFANGLLQAIAVRAAGFGAVPLAKLAPAVKYVVSTILLRQYT